MKQTIAISVILSFLLFFSCNNTTEQLPEVKDIDSVFTEQIETLDSAIEKSMNYLSNWDLDGDGINDDIYFDYTGGAHCCYILSIILSSDTLLREFPFEMDGGFDFDVDDSQPSHFNINDFDNDGLPEIFMEIATYNGVPYDIPKEWTEKYKFVGHYILFDYSEGDLIILDHEKPEIDQNSI